MFREVAWVSAQTGARVIVWDFVGLCGRGRFECQDPRDRGRWASRASGASYPMKTSVEPCGRRWISADSRILRLGSPGSVHWSFADNCVGFWRF